jgi:hypothetical protein
MVGAVVESKTQRNKETRRKNLIAAGVPPARCLKRDTKKSDSREAIEHGPRPASPNLQEIISPGASNKNIRAPVGRRLGRDNQDYSGVPWKWRGDLVHRTKTL